jgi:hypothetical protein
MVIASSAYIEKQWAKLEASIRNFDQCAKLLSPVDQGTADKITVGCPTMITSKSKEERTRIIKLPVPLRSCADLHRLMMATELRKIPKNVKKPFAMDKNIKLIKLYNFMLYLRHAGLWTFVAKKRQSKDNFGILIKCLTLLSNVNVVAVSMLSINKLHV